MNNAILFLLLLYVYTQYACDLDDRKLTERAIEGSSRPYLALSYVLTALWAREHLCSALSHDQRQEFSKRIALA